MKIINSSVRFNKVILKLIFSQSFLTVTIFGNAVIFSFSLIFYTLEGDVNPAVSSYLDAVWWGFATATTVGYGDIIPLTMTGKIIGILLMMMGTALFATYTALFAQTILEDEFFRLNLKTVPEDQSDFVQELRKHKRLIENQIRHLEGDGKKDD